MAVFLVVVLHVHFEDNRVAQLWMSPRLALGASQHILNTSAARALLTQVYCCLQVLGFESLGYLSPEDQALLVAVRRYRQFRQGEVWQNIAVAFEEQGLAPTEEDRCPVWW